MDDELSWRFPYQCEYLSPGMATGDTGSCTRPFPTTEQGNIDPKTLSLGLDTKGGGVEAARREVLRRRVPSQAAGHHESRNRCPLMSATRTAGKAAGLHRLPRIRALEYQETDERDGVSATLSCRGHTVV